ncbi:3-oxoacyl-[acyl-carrier-protein] reductase FabG [Geodia barretti]|uniref:3-ketoacyl-[acyl-carrier-protein] reductase beta subunit n=1 Tax=Geodia barretti TaxID=519541 RepID=A0AA35TVV5_GEOBA|nr:3-oxoacyl-[acyl-carrier-protein] reductase FabG [Geodia barretti]
MQLEDRIALITGGARGLGKGIALVLAERGADIAVCDINLDGAQQTAGHIAAIGREATAYEVDVTSQSQLREIGVIGAAGFEDTTTSREEDWDLTFDVNVKGTALASDAVSSHMKERRFGKIVNIASHAGRGGGAGGGAYGASKAAVIHLTQSYAMDLAPFDINVNAICPGSIWTPMWERIAVRTQRNRPEQQQLTPREIFDAAIMERCPLGREQTPEDIGKAVAFFASDDAINITGQSLNVNGGIRMN